MSSSSTLPGLLELSRQTTPGSPQSGRLAYGTRTVLVSTCPGVTVFITVARKVIVSDAPGGIAMVSDASPCTVSATSMVSLVLTVVFTRMLARASGVAVPLNVMLPVVARPTLAMLASPGGSTSRTSAR